MRFPVLDSDSHVIGVFETVSRPEMIQTETGKVFILVGSAYTELGRPVPIIKEDGEKYCPKLLERR